MQKKMLWFVLVVMMAGAVQVKAQYARQDSTYKRFFVGSTLFMLANVIPDNNPPGMIYLTAGYRVSVPYFGTVSD